MSINKFILQANYWFVYTLQLATNSPQFPTRALVCRGYTLQSKVYREQKNIEKQWSRVFLMSQHFCSF